MAPLKDFCWIVVAYLAALCAAGMCVYLLSGSHPLWQAGIADLVATFVVFGFARAYGNSSFYDAYWSVVAVLVMLWAVRLTKNWARGWQGLGHQDWRYIDLQAKTGRWYVLVDLLGIHLFPTVLVFVGCLPLWLIAQHEMAPWAVFDWLWLFVGFAALWLEARADNVLRAFRADKANHGKVLRSDVWAWCRHPNYLGEIGFWAALGIAGYGVTGNLWSWAGTALMLGLFIGISIPMIDKRQLANKPDYAAYKAEVGGLLPKLWAYRQAAD